MSKRSRGQAMLAAVSVKRTGIMRPESEKKRTDLLSKPSHHHNGEEDFKLGMKLKLARLNSSQSSNLTDQGKTDVQSTPVKENLGSSQNTSIGNQVVVMVLPLMKVQNRRLMVTATKKSKNRR